MEVLPAARAGSPPTLHLHQGPLENHCRPAVDVLFRSAATIYGPATLAVVLTGMGSDGLAACRIIRARGGIVLAQDQATSAVWGMPGAVARAGLAHRVLPLTSIAPEILRLAAAAPWELSEPHEWAAQR
jgi:two-component system, chemotaxis family, protein-glutamate methylesterase/glutaminase